MDDKTRMHLEAAAFRRLVQHLRERTEVQNIDLMNLAGFCRNCLSKWYRAEAAEIGIPLTDAEAREMFAIVTSPFPACPPGDRRAGQGSGDARDCPWDARRGPKF